MSLAWKIGALFGIPVKLHISMLLLPLLTYGWMPVDGFLGALAWLTVVVLLFGSVLLHEIGHALTARAYGVRTVDIVLTPIGGMARVIDMPRHPRHEIAIAIAGPLVSLTLAGLSFGLSVVLLLVPFLPAVVFQGLGLLIRINAILGLFNLIPALPMDGGRVLRGYLALSRDFLSATKIAARVGRSLAVVGGVVAVFFLHSWSLALISLFVYTAAGGEERLAEFREYQRRAAEGGTDFSGLRGRSWAWGWTSGENEAAKRNLDWDRPDPGSKREVLIVEGGSATVVSRKDPEEK